MGHRKEGQNEIPKDPDFWKDHLNALIAANRKDHGRLRKVFSHGFSAQAMLAQQPLIQRYVSILVEKLKAASKTGEAQEMTAWYNWTTFDIIGDLSFGEPFGCLENSYYHPWVALIFDHIRGTALLTAIRKCPFSELMVKMMMSKEDSEKYHTHLELSKANVAKRLALKEPRHDFMESIARAYEKSVSLSQIKSSIYILTIIISK
jgi:cytochrome P450